MSLMKASWSISLPDLSGASEEEHFAPLVWMLEGMITVNMHIIRWAFRRGTPIPPVYASGVVYREDPAGQENWKDCLAIMQDRFGDCDRLVAWRTAELRVAGIAAEPAIKWQHIPYEVAISLKKPDGTPMFPAAMVPREGLWLVHCGVKWPGGQIEDISKNLGMGGQYLGGV